MINSDTLRKLQLCELEILKEIHRICIKNGLKYFLIGGTLLGAVRHKGFIPWDDDLDIAMPRQDYNKFLKIFNNCAKKDYSLNYYKITKDYWLPFAKVRKNSTVMTESLQDGNESQTGIWVDIFPLDNANCQKSKFLSIRAKCAKTVISFVSAKNGTYDISNRTKGTKFFFSIMKHFSKKQILSFANFIMSLNKRKSAKYYINLGSQYNFVKQTIPKSIFEPAKEIVFEGERFYSLNDPIYFLNRIYGDYMTLPPIEKRLVHDIVKLSFDGKTFENV